MKAVDFHCNLNQSPSEARVTAADGFTAPKDGSRETAACYSSRGFISGITPFGSPTDLARGPARSGRNRGGDEDPSVSILNFGVHPKSSGCEVAEVGRRAKSGPHHTRGGPRLLQFGPLGPLACRVYVRHLPSYVCHESIHRLGARVGILHVLRSIVGQDRTGCSARTDDRSPHSDRAAPRWTLTPLTLAPLDPTST